MRVYRQHIEHPEYQQSYVEEHLRLCGKGNFKVFPFLQVRCDNTDFRKTYEKAFIAKFDPLLNKDKSK